MLYWPFVFRAVHRWAAFWLRSARLSLAIVVSAGLSAHAATLTGEVASDVGAIDLSIEGSLDWVHWGLTPEAPVNRSAAALPRISDVSNPSGVPFMLSSGLSFAWTNGTPVEATISSNVLAFTGGDTAFVITVAADTTVRRLNLHLGAIAADASVEAALSDASAPAYVDTSLSSMGETPVVYSFFFAADSPQQVLRVSVAMTMAHDANASLLLGAATLSSVGTNQPPSVSIINPTDEQSIPAGDVTLTAEAQDTDGAVTLVEFFDNGSLLAGVSAPPFSLVWTNAPPGKHVLTARAHDDGGATRISAPVTVFIFGTGGSLSSVFSAPTGTVNLTLEGQADWIHWGLVTENSINRKAGVAPLISTWSVVGSGPVFQFADNFNGYTWTDGTPRAAVTNTPTGVYIFGVNNGFELQASAANVPRTLRVHVGAFAAVGQLQAFLSDYSAPVFIDATVNNVGNGPGGIYTITYQASAPGQKLIVRYTAVNRYGTAANVTLQAASLISDNNPPTVTLLSPSDGAVIPGGTNVVVSADASDREGRVTRVDFYRDEVLFGTSSNAPFTAVWTNAAPGTHYLKARAVDDGGASAFSLPVRVFVVTGGGLLRGNIASPAFDVNLSAEGALDWVHWGMDTKNSVNRRMGGSPQIGAMSVIGSGQVQRYADNFSNFSWTNGTPTLVSSGTPTGIFITGASKGFQLTIPADQRPKRLHLYVGLYSALGRLDASLSDSSAPAYIDNSLSRSFANGYALYTLDFAAASTNQTLRVRWIAETVYDPSFGNVTWQAAALLPLSPRITALPQLDGSFAGSFFALAGLTYTVEFSDTLEAGSWQPLTTILGTGADALFFDPDLTLGTRFYRVRAE